ncbi:MAG: asparaginase [Dongiaceae bacterium]
MAAPSPASAPPGAANPVAVEVWRGEMVESRHRAAIAVVDARGRTVEQAGEVGRPVYGRSAVKPIQALPLIESGAADRWGLGPAEIALACASHSGEPRHVALVAAWLARLGLGPADLECGAQLPYAEAAAEALLRAGAAPGPLHNNCSGKHAGFLATARHLGEPTAGYIRRDHPVQRRVEAALGEMAGLALDRAPHGIDGCGIPVVGVPLERLALAMARIADPADLPTARADAVLRIRAAIAAEPFLIGGTGRFGTRLMQAVGAAALVKSGAQGVYCAALPGLGLGVALKVDDGSGPASEVVLGSVLRRLGVLTQAQLAALADLLQPPVPNRAGLETGRVRPVL